MEPTPDNPKPPPPTANRSSLGWGFAVLLVVAVWAIAIVVRAGGEKHVLPGWADGMPAGQQLAKEADKPMVVLFTAGWCPPCQDLKHDVLTQAVVNDALQAGFVPVQIDLTDRSSSNPNLEVAQQYGVGGIPTVIAMTPDGEPIEVYAGMHTPDNFTAWLDRLSE